MRLKFFAALFASDRGEENYHQKNDRFHQRHGERVIWLSVCQAETFCQPGLLLGGIRGGEISQLISESGKGPAKFRRRKFVQVHWHNSPCALHHELNQKSAHDKQRCARRENPKWNQEHPKCGRENNQTPAAPPLRKKSHHGTATDRTDRVN